MAPWYVRHGGCALFFAANALAYRSPLIAVIVFVASLVVTLAGQIALDGWDPANW